MEHRNQDRKQQEKNANHRLCSTVINYFSHRFHHFFLFLIFSPPFCNNAICISVLIHFFLFVIVNDFANHPVHILFICFIFLSFCFFFGFGDTGFFLELCLPILFSLFPKLIFCLYSVNTQFVSFIF